MSLLDNSCALYDPKKLRKTVRDSLWGGDHINYPGEVATPTTDRLQDVIEQFDVHKRGKIYDTRHLQLLPHDPTETAQIHSDETGRNTPESNRRIQTS